ncbi:MAG: nodulation protein NfeD [Rudaea sp.]
MIRSTRFSWLATACLGLVASLLLASLPVRAAQTFVAQIDLNGPIGPAAAEYVDQALSHAQADGAVAVVLRLDTPGGLSESMRTIISAILASRVPVLCYVAPEGARAASAGTYILYACQLAAMAPATHLGAATPVSIGGSTPMPSPFGDKKHPLDKNTQDKPPQSIPNDGAEKTAADKTAESQPATAGDAEANKVLNDAIAYIRSLAQLRGRNAEWAEQAVRGAATLTANEALQKHVIDLIASDTADLLHQANGRSVNVGAKSVELQFSGASVRAYKPSWRSGFLGIVTNPTIAYLLLLAGIYGLVLEAFHPGAMLPGIAGGICLLIGLYAMQLLPVNFAGLALMALGVGMLVAEVFTPTYGALGVGGVISFVFGSIMLLDTDIPGYSINIGVIGGLAFSAMFLLGLILWMVMRSRRAHGMGGDRRLLDATGKLLEPIAAGAEGRAMVEGELWRVRTDTELPAGARIRVTRREGLLLWVKPE